MRDLSLSIFGRVFSNPLLMHGVFTWNQLDIEILWINDSWKSEELETLAELENETKVCYPNYENSTVSLVNSILKEFGVIQTTQTLKLFDDLLVREYKNIVVLLLDGMGCNILRENLGEKGFFYSVENMIPITGCGLWYERFCYVWFATKTYAGCKEQFRMLKNPISRKIE